MSQLGARLDICESYCGIGGCFDEEKSWRITLRAKRGLSDTSEPGGLTKDYLYLDGYYKVKKYIETGHDIKKLYVGKIAIEHVSLVDKMENIVKPRYLPRGEKIELPAR